MASYLGRLHRRLQVTGFGPNDRLYQLAAAAHDAVFSLWVAPHYDECERDPGEPPLDWQI